MTATFTIELFGALRKHSSQTVVSVETPLPVTLADLKDRIADQLKASDPTFDPDGVFKVSAVATHETVLPRNAVLEAVAPLALIPPVSGG